MIAGAVLLLFAFIWDLAFPINKKIWTSSFALLTIGLDLLILPILIYIIEIYNRRTWTYFFVVFGRNPLFIYLLADIMLTTMIMISVGDTHLQNWLYTKVFGSFAGPVLASFLFAFFYMLLNWGVGYLMDRKRIYIKV